MTTSLHAAVRRPLSLPPWLALLAPSTAARPVLSPPPYTPPSFPPHSSRRGVKSGWSTLPHRTRPRRFNQATAGIPPPTTGPAAALARRERTTPLRAGVLAIKQGMTSFVSRRGRRLPCTVLQLDVVQAVANKTRDAHGYWAVQIGCGTSRPATVTAPLLGYFEAKGLPPKRHLAEFKVRNESGLLPVGVQLQPDWFFVGQWVDVRSNSRGMGFEGVMKRYNFAGQEKSHGNSLNHRTMGTTGPSQGGGSRVLPGKKMPGRMGNQRVTVQNLAVLMVDNDMGIVVVKGCVAGPKGAVVMISDAIKKPPPPMEFVESSRRGLDKRFPDAAQHLDEARRRHLQLKEARRQGMIGEILAAGVTEEQFKEVMADITL